MKILHLGGYKGYVEPLVKAQQALGHNSSFLFPSDTFSLSLPTVTVSDLSEVQQLADKRYDIIHFHLTESICSLKDFSTEEESTVQSLELLTKSGARLVYSSYDCDLTNREVNFEEDSHRSACTYCVCGKDDIGLDKYCSSDRKREIRAERISRYFSHVFLSCADNYPIVSKFKDWSWLPLGSDVASYPAPVPQEPSKDNFRIVHIPFRPAQMQTFAIQEAINALKQRRYRFTFDLINPAEVRTVAEFRNIVSKYDLYIEQLGRHSYGLAAVEAMTLGKTVLSGNSNFAKEICESYAMSSVLHTDSANIYNRLDSIVKEPRCCRDFGKRSRKYAEQCHNIDNISATSISVYEQILGKTR